MAPYRVRAEGMTLLAFFLLVLALAEAHECAHTVTARAICGGWGGRDFSVWATCDGCAVEHPLVELATFAGPLFTFAAMWLGVWLTRRTGERACAAGLALVFAPLPFARIFTAIMGHGDEVSGFMALVGTRGGGWMMGLATVLVFSVYPLARAYRMLAQERRLVVFAGLLVVPMLAHGLVVHGAMNRLLSGGILARDGVLGAPVIVNLWQVVVFVGAAIAGKRVSGLFAADSLAREGNRASGEFG